MAISKILYIGDCKAGYSGKHLRQALDYIANPEKTGDGKWIGALNCQTEAVYEQMRRTKVQTGKTDQRQGYHMIISFVEGEVDADTAFEVIGRFAKEYLGQDYEALYAVHDNTEHIHGHIIFNSVSFRTGRKYRYQKGDWAKKIQPITNRLCEEYGLSAIEISDEKVRSSEKYDEWNDYRDGKFRWADYVRRDIDACILQSPTYESFLAKLSKMGYQIKNAYRTEGKYLAIKPMGLTRFKRCKSLGERYSEEQIRARIETENLATYRRQGKEKQPRIVPCRIKRYKRAKLTGLQKRYFAKLYRLGQLKKRPYSQVWRYRHELRNMKRLQEDYLFLVRHDITTEVQVAMVSQKMTDKRKETSREKSRIFKARAKLKSLFDIMQELENLQEMESCYQRGEMLFEAEHEQYQKLQGELKKQGYESEQIEALKSHYASEIAKVRAQEKVVLKEDRIAKRILQELLKTDTTQKQKQEETKEQEAKKQENLQQEQQKGEQDAGERKIK